MATTTRQATPERWQAALRRASEKGVALYQISGTGQWIATSGSQPGVAYATDGTNCECEAALLGGDAVCCHRAALRQRLGLLTAEPVCTTCGGTKWIWKTGLMTGKPTKGYCTACVPVSPRAVAMMTGRKVARA